MIVHSRLFCHSQMSDDAVAQGGQTGADASLYSKVSASGANHGIIVPSIDGTMITSRSNSALGRELTWAPHEGRIGVVFRGLGEASLDSRWPP